MSWKLRSVHGDPVVKHMQYNEDKERGKEFIKIKILDADGNLDAVGEMTIEQLNAYAEIAFEPLDYAMAEYGSTTMKYIEGNKWRSIN